MVIYLDGVFLLNTAIDFLLLMSSNRLCGHSHSWRKSAAAALVGGVYSTLCIISTLSFLANPLCRIAMLLIMSYIAFGVSLVALRKTAFFILLSMALGGIVVGLGAGGIRSMLGAVACIFVLCSLGGLGHPLNTKTIPVEIRKGNHYIKINALYDTGNLLRDPVSGAPVLVVGSDICEILTGLSANQLRNPIETLRSSAISGLRLIPYKTIGQNDGILLAQYFPVVKVGNVERGRLVAFSPEVLSNDGAYQALTGGFG